MERKGSNFAIWQPCLQALDGAVQKNLPWVTEAVMDKNYMGQLVAVQHQRGAKGGEVFADALNLNLVNHRKVTSAAAANSSGVDEEIAAIGRFTQPIVPPRSTAMIPPSQVSHLEEADDRFGDFMRAICTNSL